MRDNSPKTALNNIAGGTECFPPAPYLKSACIVVRRRLRKKKEEKEAGGSDELVVGGFEGLCLVFWWNCVVFGGDKVC